MFVLSRGRFQKPILLSFQLQLWPLFWIPKAVTYESFDCIKASKTKGTGALPLIKILLIKST